MTAQAVAELPAHPEVGDRIGELQSALQSGMDLENTVLYPRAIALEKKSERRTQNAESRKT